MKKENAEVLPVCHLLADKNAYGFIGLRSRVRCPMHTASMADEAVCVKSGSRLFFGKYADRRDYLENQLIVDYP
ncbi:hypothetical protein [Phocaeicola salanitronis]|uniref:hypothetical protein n=1 Tax=Phocaeicola salanitronis TaxID=376805 RepID=UPI0025A313DF|nr:hypothetical protein [Phocaeicola salanitronis]MDM8306541.1 hypothetical protein [Phocaeicola salanitronis]